MLSWMECPACHQVTPIQRKRGKTKRRGHVKTMWCPFCKKVTPHRERF